MKQLTCILFAWLACGAAIAQQPQPPAANNASNAAVKKGNDYYLKGDFGKAADNYKKALEKDPKNTKAQYNLGNTLLRQNKFGEAAQAYDGVDKSADSSVHTDAYYNKGLAMAKAKKLPEAIDAFKQSLRYSPEDDNTRENLQKAINELKKQQQQQNQQQQKPNPQQQKQNQQKQPQQQPQQSNSKLSQQQAEQLLRNLSENEKRLQNQLQKQKGNTTQTAKDW